MLKAHNIEASKQDQDYSQAKQLQAKADQV